MAMLLLSFATLLVFALRVDCSRTAARLNGRVRSDDMTRPEFFVDANKSENRSVDDASSAQRHEGLGLTPISSHSVFEDLFRHESGDAMGDISSSSFSQMLTDFIALFTRTCSGNSEARFHMGDNLETDWEVLEADPIIYWNNDNMEDMYIKTNGISGCDGLASDGFVCHVVFKLVIAETFVEPLAGITAHSNGSHAFYMVCMGGRQTYDTQWSQIHTCHLVPESVLTEVDGGSFKQVSDDPTTMIDWSCGAPGMASDVQEIIPVASKPSVQVNVQQHEKMETEKIETEAWLNETEAWLNESSKEKCCCAEVRGQMRAFGVQFTGIQGGSKVALAVGHSGWWSGTPGHAKCPKIGGLQMGGKPCACTVRGMSWKAPNTCKPQPPHEAVKSYSTASVAEAKKWECVGLCSTPGARSSLSQECDDKATTDKATAVAAMKIPFN